MTRSMQKSVLVLSNMPRALMLIALVAFVGLVGSLNLRRALHSDVVTSPAFNMKPRPADAPRVPFARTAYAGAAQAELDQVADRVYGQADLLSGAAPTAASGTTLFSPTDMTVYETTGQLFVVDSEHNRVLGWNSVDAYQSGDSADFVLGQPDFSTTDAPNPPTANSMNAPQGVTVGFDGFLYVSDTGNNRVLIFVPCNDFYGFYVDENGDPTHDQYGCSAADVAVESSPDDPFPTFTSGMDAFYALGQFDMTSGAALGTSANTLDQPLGLVTDVHDNLVVADAGNNRVLIYEWPLETGSAAKWVLGQGTTQDLLTAFTLSAAPNPPTNESMHTPTDVAVNAEATELYVADSGNNRILVFSDEPIDTVADRVIGQPDFVSNSADGGSNAVNASGFDAPTGIEMDAGNRLFVADTGNHRVLVFDQLNPDGSADAVFGQPDFTSFTANSGGIDGSTLFSPTDIATDVFNMGVFIADAGNNRVLHYDQPLINPVPVIHELSPGTIRAGSDSFELTIRGTGIISDTVIEVDGVARADSVSFLGVAAVEIAAGEVLTAGQNLSVRMVNPTPGGGNSAAVELVVFTPTANDDVADSVLGQEGFTTDDGAFVIDADTLFEPNGVVIDPTSGHVFVADTGNDRILIWSSTNAWRDGAAAEIVIGQPDFRSWEPTRTTAKNIARPVGLALDSQGNLYAANPLWHEVVVYTAPFTNGMSVALTIGNLNNPLDVALDASDNLYIADALNHRVLFYETPLMTQDTNPDGVYGQANLSGSQANQGGAAGAATLNFPASVALDGDGNLYISDSANNRVLGYERVNDAIDNVADVVFGQVNFGDTQANQGGAVSAATLNFPYGLVVDAAGTLFVADVDNNRVLGYDDPLTDQSADRVYGQNGSFTRGRAAVQALLIDAFDNPTDVATTASGDLFVADSGNSRVLGFMRDISVLSAVELAAQSSAESTTAPIAIWLVVILAVVTVAIALRVARPALTKDKTQIS